MICRDCSKIVDIFQVLEAIGRVVNEGLQICIYAKKEKSKKMQIFPYARCNFFVSNSKYNPFFLTLATTSTIRAEVVMALLTQTL